MTFNDVIKKTVLEKFQTGNLTTAGIVLVLAAAIILGLFIYFIYRMNTRSGFYNRGFNKSLAVLPVITAAIMLAMGSNLTISLGMVGALSIVRFRNAVKDSVDLTYLFWSIGGGIIVGAGLLELAIFLSLAVAVLVSVLDLLPAFRSPCLLVISAQKTDVEDKISQLAREYSKKMKIRSRNISKRGTEWIYEIQVNDEAQFVQKIAEIESVTSVHLMTHDGEVRF